MMDDTSYYEHQILGPGPEATESAKAAEECKKNPGHENFIPVDKLTKEDIPAGFQDDDEFYEFIKVLADLTVRLRVKDNSPNRPERGYYGVKEGGTRTGTGNVDHIELEHIQDPSSDVQSGQSRMAWKFSIQTAKHVVFDDKEGMRTRADFFYDNEESRKDGSMKTATGGKMYDEEENLDWCKLHFITFDAELGTKLLKLHKRKLKLGDRLGLRYSRDSSNKMMWIVSHPHGIAKHVTFGELKDEKQFHRNDFQYSYSVPTCKGSSGAAVWRLKLRRENYWKMLRLSNTFDNCALQILGRGPEAQESTEAARQCEIQFGHEGFIPIDKLTRQLLPMRYQEDEDIFEFIKVVAAQTVRVRVGSTSSKRPEAAVKNPFTSVGAHTGTGLISYVWCYGETCSTCEHEPEERCLTFKFLVETTKEVVFDEEEAETTTIDIFYDNEASREVAMKTMTGGKVWDKDIDSCRLVFTSCDFELLGTLMDLHKQREVIGERLVERYWSNGAHNLIWIVSHPHGIAKHITLGEIEEDEAGDHHYTIEPDFCPGCNGAELWRTGLCGNLRYHTSVLTGTHCKGGGKNGWNVGYY